MLPIIPLSPYAAGTSRTDRNSERLTLLRAVMSDYQQQLATGKKADTFGGLGTKRVTSIDSRARLSVLDGFTSVIDQATTRVSIMSKVVNRIGKAGDETKEVAIQSTSTPDAATIAVAQTRITGKFEEMLGLLNESGDGLYLFSGRTRDVKPVASAQDIINGVGGNAGLRQMVLERRQADAGVTGTGRLNVTVAGATVTLAEQAAGLPFGIKLQTAPTGTMTGLTSTGPAGAPPALTFTFAALPVDGERVTVRLTLPGGGTRSFDLLAGTTNATSADASFAIGATPAATAANLQASLLAKVQEIAATDLGAASALAASQDFFSGSNSNPPPRVAGPPFNTSVAFAAPGSRPTVIWYQGDDDPAVAARDTALAQADVNLRLSIGARANEDAIRNVLAGLGAIVADDFTGPPATASAKYVASAALLLQQIGNPGGTDEVFRIESEFGAAQKTMNEVRDRHQGTKTLLENIIADVEDANTEEVSTALLALRTRLEISYQATALMSRLSLTNYVF